ncbi:M3 family metallopeptidase [Jonesia quinghaiensis]|uniref:M3 family metallopeptidase n=1 Tax=Jonesia quinghaiensis TaxID=262806 RepID=UPI00049047EB|nr:M3 family metallopeptidase [Jonesia quinghaiensis]
MTIEHLDPSNPFALPSTLPYSLPDFTQIADEHYEPAIRAGMAQELAEIDAIATNSEPATVQNTLDAFELSGQVLSRALTVFYNTLSSDARPTLEDIDERLAPELARHHDEIYMNTALYQRFTDLEQNIQADDSVSAEVRYALQEVLKDFVRSGITLSDDDKATLRGLNEKITALESAFGRKLLAGANDGALFVQDAADLAGLAPDAIDAARSAATQRGHDTGYLIELQLPSQQASLAQLSRRDVREKLFHASVTRGLAGEHDTRTIIVELATLRAQAAQLLGFEHHAAYIAEDATARTTPAVMEMLNSLAPSAVRNAHAEAQVLAQALREDLNDPQAVLEPWDWAYYAEKVRARDYDLDDSVLRPYLELDRVVRDGVFRAATELYGITFTDRPDLTGYHPDVAVFEVFDADGSELGLFLADWYTRESKRGGAWMNNLVDQSHLTGQRPVVVNNLNIPKPPAGQPTLLAWDEVITLFHEFGHALHGLFANTHYPSYSGTEVPRDFVEFPSQVNEMWAWEPEILRHYARHHATGEPMPTQWIDTLLATRQFNEGFATTEYLAAAILDQAWHQLDPRDVPSDPEQVEAFEKEALTAHGIAEPLVPPRYRSTYYNHVFGGGYSAGYYSYIWSEVLDADTVEWFSHNGGLSRQAGDHFRATLLAPGGSQDCLETYRTFRGRDAHIQPLLTRRGLEAAQ